MDPGAAGLPGVSVLGLDSLEDAGLAVAATQAEDVAAVRAIVADELAARVSARHAARVSPTVVALRAKAAEVVEAELDRLTGKLGSLDERAYAEISRAMQRVVYKLLHAPTVRVKELAGSPGGDSYEAALRVLFDLDQDAIDAVTRADDLTLGGGAMSARVLRLGTRKSPMAMAQSQTVANLIMGRTGIRVELVGLTSFGDVSPARLTQIGGTGVFVSALRTCLLAGDIDLAVHSLKDLPTADVPGIVLAAVPVREDPRDALVARDGAKLADLPAGGADRHRIAAPGRPVAADAPGYPPGPGAGERRHPPRQGHLRRTRRRRAGARGAGPDRPSRSGHRGLRAG